MSHSTAHRLSNLHRHLQSHHSPLSHEEKASRENSYCSVRPPISLKGGNRTRRTSTRNQLCHLNLHNRHIYIPSKRHAAAGCGYNTCLRHAAANKGALHNMLAARSRKHAVLGSRTRFWRGCGMSSVQLEAKTTV